MDLHMDLQCWMLILACILTFVTDFNNDSWIALVNKEHTEPGHLCPAPLSHALQVNQRCKQKHDG